MSDINSRSTAQQMHDVCNEVREAASLDWNNCTTYCSDNKNYMIGQRNSLLQDIRSAKKVTKRFLKLVALLERDPKNFLQMLKILLLTYTITLAGMQNRKSS